MIYIYNIESIIFGSLDKVYPNVKSLKQFWEKVSGNSIRFRQGGGTAGYLNIGEVESCQSCILVLHSVIYEPFNQIFSSIKIFA